MKLRFHEFFCKSHIKKLARMDFFVPKQKTTTAWMLTPPNFSELKTLTLGPFMSRYHVINECNVINVKAFDFEPMRWILILVDFEPL